MSEANVLSQVDQVRQAALKAVLGRERELQRIDEHLLRRQPELVLLCGEANMGKTSFLREVVARAQAKEWRTTYSNSEDDLSVTSATNEHTFADTLRRLLSLPADEALNVVEKTEDYSDTGTWKRKLLDERSARSEKMQTALEKKEEVSDSGIWKRKLIQREGSKSPTLQPRPVTSLPTDTTPPLPTVNAVRRLHGLVRQLRQVGSPVLIVIDGYRPNAEFERWLVHVFVDQCKKALVPVLILIADRESHIEPLRFFADEVITLGPLDPAAVRSHFSSIGDQLVPRMEAAELERYVEAACQDPTLISSLTHVLVMAIPQTETASTAPRSG